MEPERLQRASQAHGSSLKIGLTVGVIWMIAQFGISEVLYRLGNASGADVLYNLSNTVAWPAEIIYHQAEVELFSDELARQ